jgi:glycosyltransferase involved in cell wall biosynthesis
MDQNIKPKVSVIMAVYNGEKYIAEAIESILAQTMKDFELVIVDDGSIDNTIRIIQKFNDSRIILLKNEVNKGSIFSRNRAVKESSAAYIAILDSDDVAMPERFEIESRFLDEHAEFGVIGSAVSLIDSESKERGIIWKNTLPAKMVPGILLFQNYLANSSSMFRREALPPGDTYRDTNPADDYDLWLRIDTKWSMWNLPQVLVKYRVHDANMSTIDSERKNVMVNKMITEKLAKLDIIPTEEELKIHRTNYGFVGDSQTEFLLKREKWLQMIKKQNGTVKYYETNAFNTVITERWLASCNANTNLGFGAWRIFWKSSLSNKIPSVLWTTVFRFAVKCALKKQ